ncbi:MAG: glutamate-5-semialdehyde dehydrogenase [Flammeovirgaceae bacterium]
MTYQEIFKSVQEASKSLVLLSESQINQLLNDLAEETIKNIPFILAENEKDLARMDKNDPKYDRLLLNSKRLEGIAQDLRNVAKLPAPLGKILMEKTMPNGLKISKITVPLGVVGIIYEARPNVTFDVFSLCLKTGNACLLKGGSEAEFSNKAIVKIIRQVIENHKINKNIIALMPSERVASEALLNAIGFVDVLIPRGSQALIDYVRQNAKVPVIETGAGIVHTYFDEFADLQKGIAIIHNAKTRRVSVCNALDCLIIHEKRLKDLSAITNPLAQHEVIIFADEKSYNELKGKYPENLLQVAQKEHFGTEFLSYKMAIKTVSSLEEALKHIDQYSSKHSEAIISENEERIDKFLKIVDAAAVYANASTAFTDGGQFGLGAEIGISTQKLHARGPMALEEMTSYKWVIKGNGQIRS